MRIELKSAGGIAHFPGLSKPVQIDSEHLPPAEAAELVQLVAGSNFFRLPQQISGQASGAADYREYTLTIDEGGRCHTVCYTDLDDAPQLDALRRFILKLARQNVSGGGSAAG